MDKREFIEYIKKNMKSYLPEEYKDATIEIFPVSKLNYTYTGLSVKVPGQTIVPTIGIDSAFDKVKTAEDAHFALCEICLKYLQEATPNYDVSYILDYSKAKTKIFMKLVGSECNAELLKEIPHIDIENLSLTFHIMLDEEVGDNSFSSATIQNQMLDLWGIDEAELHEVALKNSERLLPLRISTLAEQIMLLGVDEQVGESPLVYVSNEKATFGAAALFYPGAMEKVREWIGGSFYILPSSVHEVMVLPELKDPSDDVNVLLDMVTDVNRTAVDPREKLADAVYFYNADTKEFSKIA